MGTLYVLVMDNLRRQLIEAFERSDQAILDRSGPECRAIFKDLTQEDFVEMLRSATGKPDVECTNQFFRLKKTYPVEDKESLKQYLLSNGTYGITLDDKLLRCYKGIKRDIDELITEGWIRVITTQEGTRGPNKESFRVLFPRDLTEKEVEFTPEELPENCHSYLAQIWSKDVGDNTTMNWEQVL